MKTDGVDGSYTVFKIEGKSWGGVSFSKKALAHIPEAPVLILDVKGLDFDSMLIGEIVVLQRELAKHWGDTPHRLVLADLNKFSRRVFEQVKLEHILDFSPSVSAAVKNL